MNILKYISQNGIKHTVEIIYIYKIDIVIQKVCGVFLRKKPLKDIIVIESHNDFDSNGGAFYNYLIKNGYNRKYKIVWAIKHPEAVPQELPENVDWYAEYKPGVKKNYYKWIARWFSSDMNCGRKLRKNQITIYQTHGSLGLKNCVGVINLPDNLDYCLVASEYFAQFEAKQYSWEYPNDKFRFCGFPAHDVFYTSEPGDLHKITNETYAKTILWMPTFRKSVVGRCDGTDNQPLGIPLVTTAEAYFELNRCLKERNICLIIKLHPKQDLSEMKKLDATNIKVLTGDDVKKKGVDNYRLMKDCDALISDYSSAAHEFLHTQKPVAYDFSDLSSYTRGIIVEDPHELIAGHEIRTFADLLKFIDDIANDVDPYKEQRAELFDRLFKYHDGNSSERVANLLKLEK